ncbi:MAG: hypothetical protein H7039_21030, partial [Bryobacteraceae bacterium]|nr:hypothetical protein [Bryobacteraceae bacterium]
PGAVATAAGFINGTGSIGQMLSPWLVVWIAGQYGWNNLFYFFAALALTGSLVLTFSRQEAVEPVLA